MTATDYRLPAEWEPQSLVQLTWPHRNTDWAPMLSEITATYVAMAQEIARREPLLIVAPSAEDVPQEISQRDNVAIFACPTNDTWARDHGFITLVPDPATATDGPLLLDFRFNGWGEKFAADHDNAINRRLWEAQAGTAAWQYEDHNDLVLEGGAIESDGQGTVFTTSPCLLAPHRNQPLDREQLAEQLKRRLRAKRIVWLDHGHLIGDDTDGHIDTIVRCAPNDTLLYIGCDDKDDAQYDDFRALEEQLHSLRTMQGKPYRLMRLPMPRPICDDAGERLPATYANFLVINGAVLVPTYGQPEHDSRAIDIIGTAFPDRQVVAIDSRPIICQHGSIHCCTMQFPATVHLFPSQQPPQP